MAVSVVCPGCRSVLTLAVVDGVVTVSDIKKAAPPPPRSDDDILKDIIDGGEGEEPGE